MKKILFLLLIFTNILFSNDINTTNTQETKETKKVLSLDEQMDIILFKIFEALAHEENFMNVVENIKVKYPDTYWNELLNYSKAYAIIGLTSDTKQYIYRLFSLKSQSKNLQENKKIIFDKLFEENKELLVNYLFANLLHLTLKEDYKNILYKLKADENELNNFNYDNFLNISMKRCLISVNDQNKCKIVVETLSKKIPPEDQFIQIVGLIEKRIKKIKENGVTEEEYKKNNMEAKIVLPIFELFGIINFYYSQINLISNQEFDIN